MAQTSDEAIREQAIAEITAEADGLIAAWKAKDADRILSHFADDARWMEPETSIRGIEGAREYVGYAAGEPSFSLEMTRGTVDAAASGDLGYVHGIFTVGYTNPETGQAETSKGNFIAILRRQADGGWKIVEDISTLGEPLL
jgi:uncharacterized protein (TIGR02246 family)